MIAVVPVETYWTFVVRAILPVSRFQPDRPTKETLGAENERHTQLNNNRRHSGALAAFQNGTRAARLN